MLWGNWFFPYLVLYLARASSFVPDMLSGLSNSLQELANLCPEAKLCNSEADLCPLALFMIVFPTFHVFSDTTPSLLSQFSLSQKPMWLPLFNNGKF